MSKLTKTVLIVTGVLLVCIIGAGVILGVWLSGGNGVTLSGLLSGRRITVDETKTLDLSSASSVAIQCSSGRVTVLPGDEPKVHMKSTLWTALKKDGYLDIEDNSGNILIKPDFGTSVLSSDVDMTVYLPQDSGLNLSIDCSSVNTTVQQLNLGDVSVSCASGRTNISGCKGGSLKVGSASGGIDVSGSQFASLSSGCQSGDINISDTSAPCTIKCTSGRVKVTDVTGALDINSISGGASVSLSGANVSPIMISVTSGSLDLSLNSTAAFDLDANTTSGGIKCDFDRTVSGNSSSGIVGDHIQGKCNGGGVPVTLSTVSGNISVFKK